jgi:hypothetical protein
LIFDFSFLIFDLVSEKFSLSRGEVQNLMNSASSFAASVLQFCKEIQEFWAYQVPKNTLLVVGSVTVNSLIR